MEGARSRQLRPGPPSLSSHQQPTSSRPGPFQILKFPSRSASHPRPLVSPSFPPDSPLRLPFTHGVCALRSHGLVASSRLLSTLQGPIEMPLPLGRDLDSSQQAAASLQAPGGEMSGVNDVGRSRVRPSETHPSTSWPLTGGGGGRGAAPPCWAHVPPAPDSSPGLPRLGPPGVRRPLLHPCGFPTP